MDGADTPKPDYDGSALAAEGQKWMERIRAAEKREDDWRKDAMAAEKAYSCDTKSDKGKLYDFNILHSNVETIVPAIYNSTPVPDIRRRYVEAMGEPPAPPQVQEGQQPDPRALAQFQQAMAQWQAKEQADKDAKNLGDMVERVISVQIDDNRLDKEIEAQAQDAFLAGRGIVRLRFEASVEGDAVSNERIIPEVVAWRDFRMGPATRWDNVPWTAFRHTVSREVLERDHTNPDMYAAQGPEVPTKDDDCDDIPIWEVWDKFTGKVKFVREHDGRMLNETDDPMGLPGFYPIPCPVQPITLTGKMTPVCPFTVYKKLADELDTITRRINAIMKGLKVRGIAAGELQDIQQLAQAGDNEIVTSSNLEGLAQTKGIENAIMWWPIEQSVKVLKELYVQREQVKTSIYEITGISDIVRGASNPNETLGAQEIKTQWGALRIQKMQRMIERQVRDIFVMMSSLILTKFSLPTLQQMSGIQITPGMQQFMQNSTLVGYRIDVESDSTVRADLTRKKGEMGEFLQGTGNFFNAIGSVVEQAPEMAEPFTEVYTSFARVFKLGKQAEDALERMGKQAKQAASKPRPNPEQDKLNADMKMKQAEFQMKEQAEQRKAVREQQSEQAKLHVESQKAQIDLQKSQTELQIKVVELDLKKQEAAMKLQSKAAENAIRLNGQQQQNKMKAQQSKEKSNAGH